MSPQVKDQPNKSQKYKSSFTTSNRVAEEEQNNYHNSQEGLMPVGKKKNNTKINGNIIFVHGLGADRYKTWNCRKWLKAQFWPEWLAEDLSDFNVWLFGYKTKPFFLDFNPCASSLDDIAKFLINEIADKELDKKPLIFITHSLGGLVVKAMLKVADNKKYLSIIQNTKGVVFIATPHQGSELAMMVKNIKDKKSTVLDILENIVPLKFLSKNKTVVNFLVTCMDFLAPTSIVEALIPDEAQLKDLTNFYQRQSKDLGIVTLAFYEMYDMWGFTVVDQDSANPEIGQKFLEPINKNHITIAKCESRKDILYKAVKQLIENYNDKLKKIKEREQNHFGEVSKSLQNGNLIFFIGSGINLPDNETTVLSDKTKGVIKVCKFPPSDQSIAHELTLKSHIKTDEILGTPCQICPIHPKDRPVDQVNGNQEDNKGKPLCPVMEKIDKKRNTNQQLIEEEDLAFAKLQIRCHGQFIKEINGSIDKILQGLYRNAYDCNEWQKLLVEIISLNEEERDAFPLIITTNYDCGIEQAFKGAFNKKSKENEKSDNWFYKLSKQLFKKPSSKAENNFKKNKLDVLYYSGDYTLEKGYIIRANPNWKLISYTYHNETESLKIDNIKRLTCENVGSDCFNEETLKKNPVLIKLCGGQIYGEPETESQWKFAISGINSIQDLAETRMLSNLVITDFCRTHDILFLGYSATDSELQDMLYTLVPPLLGRERNSRGWLINQSDIGELNNKIANYWHNWNIEIEHNYSWKNYLEKLEKYLIDHQPVR